MTSRAEDQVIHHFGPFRLDPTECLLLRDGRSVPLTPKSFDLLVYLVEHHGRLVEKQTLMEALWRDTVVEEVNLAYNVSALRKALDDDRDGPSMIQTVPTRGYRFVAPVTSSSPMAAATSAMIVPENGDEHTALLAGTRVSRFAIAFVGISCAAAAAAFLSSAPAQRRVPPATAAGEPTLVRLTWNPAELSVTSAHISPDGRYLAYADPTGLTAQLVDTGERHHLANTKGMNVYGWSPDSAQVLAAQCDERSCLGWTISLVGQERRRTGAAWPAGELVKAAPDGLRLLRLAAWSGGVTLSVDLMDGAREVRLATGEKINAASWSVDGTHVLFVRGAAAIERVPAEGGTSVEVFRAPKDQLIFDAVELPNRSILMAMMPPGEARPSGEVELWKLQTDERGMVREAPRRLTSAASSLSTLSVSRSGERVAFLSSSEQYDVYVADCDLRHGLVHPPRRFTLNDRDDLAFDWTPDSRTVLISSYRNGTDDIFKQPVDSDTAEPFLTGPRNQAYPFVTSDGRWVLYADGTHWDDSIMRVPLSGGTPKVVVPHVGPGRLQCAVRGRCVLLEQKDHAFVISWLDPVEGRGTELARLPLYLYGFHILPDGDAFAYVLPEANGVRNRVRVISFSGKPSTDIVVQNATALIGIRWLPSDSGFLTSDRGNLLMVSRSGTTHVLWAPGSLSVFFAVPSPDEKHLAINTSSGLSNAWMVTGF